MKGKLSGKEKPKRNFILSFGFCPRENVNHRKRGDEFRERVKGQIRDEED